MDGLESEIISEESGMQAGIEHEPVIKEESPWLLYILAKYELQDETKLNWPWK